MKNVYEKIRSIERSLTEASILQVKVNISEGEFKRSAQTDVVCTLGAAARRIQELINEISQRPSGL